MQIATIQGERRERQGRTELKTLRSRGFIPAVIYGHGKENENVALNKRELQLALDLTQKVINLSIDGKEQQYLLKSMQYDHLQTDPVHADLMRVDPNERVRVKASIELRGDPKGAKEGGVLVSLQTEIEVECRLVEIPGTLRVKIDDMGLNDSLYARDIDLPEGVTAVAPDELVATVSAKRGVSVSTEDEEESGEGTTAEPEVIGRVAKESEGEAST